MNRRSFFKSLLAGVGALACWPLAKYRSGMGPDNSDGHLTVADIRRAARELDEAEANNPFIVTVEGQRFVWFQADIITE